MPDLARPRAALAGLARRARNLSRRRVGTAVGLLAAAGVIVALAYHWGYLAAGHHHRDNSGTNAAGPDAGGTAATLTIWLTGYSWQDNTPPGSSKVGEPVLHHRAGGTGTYQDPITVATPGHAGDQPWAPGTRFYLPTVQRYVIVEDSGAATPPEGTDTHLDMWIGGADGTKAATDACENTFTGTVPAQVNPPANLPVMPGSIFADGQCHVPPQTATGTYHGGDHE